MLCYIFMLVSAIGGGLLVGLTQIAWWWFFPISIGIYILLNPLYFCGLWISTIFLPKETRVSPACRWMVWFSTDWFVKMLRIKVKLMGAEKFPDGPFVLVSNHRSNFDPIVVLSVMRKRKIAFISKASNFKIPVAGAYVRNCGFLAIDRENAMSALRTLKKAGEMMNAEQMIMGIYPEGTRSKNGELLEFKEGAFLLAKRANAPIVVMTTKGTEQIKKRLLWRSTCVNLDVVEVIDRETVKSTPLTDLCAQVRQSIKKGLE